MTQFGPEQLLQLAFAVSAFAVAIIAGVFLLVLHATRRRCGMGWFWGWTFLSLTLGLLAAAQVEPRFENWLALAATCTAIASTVTGVAGAFSFHRERISTWAFAVVAVASAAALFFQWRADLLGDLAAVEIPIAASAFVQAVVMFPMARTARMSGLQMACAVQILLTIMMSRTLLAAAILALNGKQLTELYWCFELTGGLILAFVLAMGELVALLDEIRVEMETANDALNQALGGLEVAAKLDPLTGLYNRYAFYTLMSEVAEKGELRGTIAIIDLNDLKCINDSYGHHAGDRALLNVAMRLQQVVRQSDYVFRWGGDEFVVVLFGMALDAARERLTHFPPPAPLEFPEQQPVPLTVSWGVAPLQRDVDAALHDADEQLYAQKRLLTRAAARVPKS